MYFRLTTDSVDENVYLEREGDEVISLITGAPLADDTPVPFRFTMEVDTDEDGEPQDPIMYSYIEADSLMETRLVETLRAAGVDNIQTFPAVITNPETDEEIESYVAANIVGLVSCANLEQSETEPLADLYYFHDLVLDPKKTGDLLMFRLAESLMDVIVHESVARAIEAGRFTGVVLEPLREA
jgi:hypothetical protein